MTDLKVAVAAFVVAGLVLLAAIVAGRGYRTASDLTIYAVEVSGSARSTTQPTPHPAPAAARAVQGRGSAEEVSRTRPETPHAAGGRTASRSEDRPAPPSSVTSATSSSETFSTTPSPITSATTPSSVIPPTVIVEREVQYGSTDDYEEEYEDKSGHGE